MFAPQKPDIIFVTRIQVVHNSENMDIKKWKSGINAWSSSVNIFCR